MDSVIHNLFRLALSSHDTLSEEDINYAMSVLPTDPLILLHLFRDNYMGKVSPKFNQQVDNMIKERKVNISLDPHIDLSNLTSQERDEMLYIESILLSTLKNTINYIKIFDQVGYSFNKIFRERLSDICVEINYPIETFNVMVEVPVKSEVGSILRISHNTLIDLKDLYTKKDILTPELLKKYQKEIKILYKN